MTDWPELTPEQTSALQSLCHLVLLRGIELGLMAANKAVEALVSAGDLHIEEESALEEASIAILALNPDTIAREAQDTASEKEAKDD